MVPVLLAGSVSPPSPDSALGCRMGLWSSPGAVRSQLDARAAPGLQPAPLPRGEQVPQGQGPFPEQSPQAHSACTRCCHPLQPPHPLGLPTRTGQPQLPLPFHTLLSAPKLNPGPKPSPAQVHREGEPQGRQSPALWGVTQVGTGTP